MTARLEDKTCPRCGTRFGCSAGSPLPCQCAGVALSPEESAYVSGRYADCLCVACLRALKTERESRP
ncbi:MAG: cysteine-rich CWC family protein [Gammaproteobacteria bacterium]